MHWRHTLGHVGRLAELSATTYVMGYWSWKAALGLSYPRLRRSSIMRRISTKAKQ